MPKNVDLVSKTKSKRKNAQNFGNMTSETDSCEICTAPAVVYKQYGAVCCFSCRYGVVEHLEQFDFLFSELSSDVASLTSLTVFWVSTAARLTL